MTVDHWLVFVLVLAALFRYHRSAIERAEERFQKCDQERIQLHNFFYGKDGASFLDVKNEAAPVSEIPDVPHSAKEKYLEQKERIKQQLKRIARTRPANLGAALRAVEYQGRPKFRNTPPAMDAQTAAQLKDKISRDFADIEDQVKNGRATHAGG